MPFSGNTYSLPAGSIIPNGTASDAPTQHNAPLNDIAAALTALKVGLAASVSLLAVYALLPRVAPAEFAGTIIPAYVSKVSSCTGPLTAKHSVVNLRKDFEVLFGSQMGTEDVYLDCENTSGFASDAAGAGRGEKRLPYLTIAAAQAHANRRILYLMGRGTDDYPFFAGSLRLNAGGSAAMPLMVIPIAPNFTFYGSGSGTAQEMQAAGAGWVPDTAGGKPEMYEKISASSQEPEAIYVRLSDRWEDGEIELPYYNSKNNAYNAKYGWFVDTGTKLISMRDGENNLAEFARLGRIRIVWRRNSISTFQGLPVYIERCTFDGLSQQARFETQTLSGTPTDVKATVYMQDCTFRDSGGLAGYGFKSFGCDTILNRCRDDGTGFDGKNYDPDTYTGLIPGGTLRLPQAIEIDCISRGAGQLQHRTLRSLIDSGFPGLRNLQASSAHAGYILRINPDYADTLGQVIADTNSGQASIIIGGMLADPRAILITNPSATTSPFPNADDQYYDTKYLAGDFYGKVYCDGTFFGGPTASVGLNLTGSFAIGYAFNSTFEGDVSTNLPMITYNPSTGAV